MVLKQFFFNSVVALMIVVLAPFASFAQTTDQFGNTISNGLSSEEASKFLASSPSECATTSETIDNKKVLYLPSNCIYLEEPIGGRVGYDLFVKKCVKGVCETVLWNGGTLGPNDYGPVQAVLSYEPDKPYQGPFGLLYNYLGLVYNYMSGIIVGLAVLFVVIGGIQMSTSAGDSGRFDAGKNRIVKSIVGLILWFTASLILYTINPTFFAF